MNDAPQSTSAAPSTFPSARKIKSAPVGRPIPRRTYVWMRLEEIAVEIAGMVNERGRLFAALADRYEQDGPKQQDWQVQCAYLAQRLGIVRIEQAHLSAEIQPPAPARDPMVRRPYLVYSSAG